MGHDNTALRIEILKRHNLGATAKSISDDLCTNEIFVERVIKAMYDAKTVDYLANRDRTVGKQMMAINKIINRSNRSPLDFVLFTNNKKIKKLAVKLKFIEA